MNKIFVGRLQEGKYPDQVDIGFTKDHLDLLVSHLNKSGWVNCRLNKGRESGKMYMEIVVPELKTSPSTQPKYQATPTYNNPPAPKPVSTFPAANDFVDDLPF